MKYIVHIEGGTALPIRPYSPEALKQLKKIKHLNLEVRDANVQVSIQPKKGI